MCNKRKLLTKANELVKQLGKEPSNQIKHALNYLRRKKDISPFKSFLNASHYSDASQKHWKPASGQLEILQAQYGYEELLYILSWAFRLRKYHYPDK